MTEKLCKIYTIIHVFMLHSSRMAKTILMEDDQLQSDFEDDADRTFINILKQCMKYLFLSDHGIIKLHGRYILAFLHDDLQTCCSEAQNSDPAFISEFVSIFGFVNFCKSAHFQQYKACLIDIVINDTQLPIILNDITLLDEDHIVNLPTNNFEYNGIIDYDEFSSINETWESFTPTNMLETFMFSTINMF